MSIEENKEIVRCFNNAWNDGKVEVIDQLAAPGCLLGGVSPQEFKVNVTEARAVVHDMQLNIDELLAEGERVMLRWTTTGTVQSSSATLQGWPIGSSFNVTGVSIYTIRDGKIVVDWSVSNYTEMMEKAGGN